MTYKLHAEAPFNFNAQQLDKVHDLHAEAPFNFNAQQWGKVHNLRAERFHFPLAGKAQIQMLINSMGQHWYSAHWTWHCSHNRTDTSLSLIHI